MILIRGSGGGLLTLNRLMGSRKYRTLDLNLQIPGHEQNLQNPADNLAIEDFGGC